MTNDEFREGELDENTIDTGSDYSDDVSNEDEGETFDSVDWESEAKKWKAIAIRNRKKTNQSTVEPVRQNVDIKNDSSLSREEAVLLAQGFSEEDLDKLKIISQGAGISLKEAKENEIFQAYLSKKEADKKAQKATMGASKGSGTVQKQTMSGLSEEEHRKIWKEKMGW